MAKPDWEAPLARQLWTGQTVLETLGDAGRYILAQPRKMQRKPHWMLATMLLLDAAKKRGPMIEAATRQLIRAIRSEGWSVTYAEIKHANARSGDVQRAD